MTLDWNDTVFFKTVKAQEELANRCYGLKGKARQLLVMLDGCRTLGALANQLMPMQDLCVLAKELKANGFISPTPEADSVAGVSALQVKAPEAAIPIEVTRPEPIQLPEEALDPVRLTRTKAYLIEVSQQHLGLMASKLQQEVARANDPSSFRSALAHWNMALRESRTGSKEADLCLQQANDLIGWKA